MPMRTPVNGGRQRGKAKRPLLAEESRQDGTHLDSTAEKSGPLRRSVVSKRKYAVDSNQTNRNTVVSVGAISSKEESSGTLLCYRFAPQDPSDLAIHPAKWREMQNAVTESCGPTTTVRVLVISGPSGCGKRAAAREAFKQKLGKDPVLYWESPLLPRENDDEWQEGWSHSKHFFGFLNGTVRGSSLIEDEEESSAALRDRPRVVAVDNFPHSLFSFDSRHLEQKRSYGPRNIALLEAALLDRCRANQVRLLLFFLSETEADNNLLEWITSTIPGSCLRVVRMNAIAPTILSKRLSNILHSVRSGSPLPRSPLDAGKGKRVGGAEKELIDALCASSNGDIRNALLSLQFVLAKPDLPVRQPANRGSSILGGGISPGGRVFEGRVSSSKKSKRQSLPLGKDGETSLFHALGTSLWNKRSLPPGVYRPTRPLRECVPASPEIALLVQGEPRGDSPRIVPEMFRAASQAPPPVEVVPVLHGSTSGLVKKGAYRRDSETLGFSWSEGSFAVEVVPARATMSMNAPSASPAAATPHSSGNPRRRLSQKRIIEACKQLEPPNKKYFGKAKDVVLTSPPVRVSMSQPHMLCSGTCSEAGPTESSASHPDVCAWSAGINPSLPLWSQQSSCGGDPRATDCALSQAVASQGQNLPSSEDLVGIATRRIVHPGNTLGAPDGDLTTSTGVFGEALERFNSGEESNISVGHHRKRTTTSLSTLGSLDCTEECAGIALPNQFTMPMHKKEDDLDDLAVIGELAWDRPTIATRLEVPLLSTYSSAIELPEFWKPLGMPQIPLENEAAFESTGKPQQLPPCLLRPRSRRPPLAFDPEALLDDLHMDAPRLLPSMLFANYLTFFSETADVAEAAERIALVDVLLTKDHTAALGTQIMLRTVADSNTHPRNPCSGGGALFRPAKNLDGPAQRRAQCLRESFLRLCCSGVSDLRGEFDLGTTNWTGEMTSSQGCVSLLSALRAALGQVLPMIHRLLVASRGHYTNLTSWMPPGLLRFAFKMATDERSRWRSLGEAQIRQEEKELFCILQQDGAASISMTDDEIED